MTEQRITRLQVGLRHHGLDALVVGALPHIRYLTNFTGSNALCVIRRRSGTLYTDTRYARQSALEVKGVNCRITKSDLIEAAVGSGVLRGSSLVGFESRSLVYEQYRKLRRLVPGVRLVPVEGLVEALTEVKEDSEVRHIQAAVSISERVLGKILHRIRPGVTELDIAAEISCLHRKFGAEGDAFEPMVASGRRSALPHSRPTRNRIKNGDIVVLDLGCSMNGYHSDITRTVAVGKASQEVRRMYAAVLSASNKALENAHALLPARELDHIARRQIAAAGLARYFVHSLGHGLGIQVHEGPRISPLSHEVLKAGNVVTIEPGVYVPSLGGVRIEDDVLITESGCKPLSHARRELLIV